ncbi:MAG TPA: hypothetical protein VIJ93_01330 [bacterium]
MIKHLFALTLMLLVALAPLACGNRNFQTPVTPFVPPTPTATH